MKQKLNFTYDHSTKNVGDDIDNLTAAEKWGKFLIYADDEAKRDYIKELCLQEEGIMAAQGILSKISQDDINWAREFSHDKWVTAWKTGIVGARERGYKEGYDAGIANSQAEIEALKARIAQLEAATEI